MTEHAVVIVGGCPQRWRWRGSWRWRRSTLRLPSGAPVRTSSGRARAEPGPGELGRRMPDLDLVTADGTLRVFTPLQGARPLLDLGHTGPLDIMPWADRVQLFSAEYVGALEFSVIGVVAAPAVLIRPDAS